MKNKLIFILVIALIGFVAFSLFGKKTEKVNPLTKIRIGWQIPWSTEGQLTQILKKTEILKNNGIEAEFKGFASGAPLNEAALSGGVDVIFTADQPAATLLAKNNNWKIIGRLMYNRVSLYVPPNSPIVSIKDLKGKTVAMPFGAAAQRMALKAEQEAGLDPKKDVNNINLGIYEQGDVIKDIKAIRWGKIDAMAGFDPTPAIFEEKGLVRNLKVETVVSVIVMSNDYIKANPDAPVKFLKSFYDTYDFYRLNVSTANQWFVEEAKLSVSPKVLEIASDVEPNLKVTNKKDIRLGFVDGDYKIMQDAADFIFDQGLIKTKITMKDFVDLSYLEKISL